MSIQFLFWVPEAAWQLSHFHSICRPQNVISTCRATSWWQWCCYLPPLHPMWAAGCRHCLFGDQKLSLESCPVSETDSQAPSKQQAGAVDTKVANLLFPSPRLPLPTLSLTSASPTSCPRALIARWKPPPIKSYLLNLGRTKVSFPSIFPHFTQKTKCTQAKIGGQGKSSRPSGFSYKRYSSHLNPTQDWHQASRPSRSLQMPRWPLIPSKKLFNKCKKTHQTPLKWTFIRTLLRLKLNLRIISSTHTDLISPAPSHLLFRKPII